MTCGRIAISAAVAALLGACSPVAPSASPSPSQTTVASSIAPSASASPSAAASPSASTRSSRPSGCDSQTILVSRASEPAPICLRTGQVVHLVAPPSLQAWAVPESSDPRVASCTGTTQIDGSMAADCVAHRAGTATVSTHTAPYAGDPQGPPQYRWSLPITVV
jgi:hypothetical protein